MFIFVFCCSFFFGANNGDSRYLLMSSYYVLGWWKLHLIIPSAGIYWVQTIPALGTWDVLGTPCLQGACSLMRQSYKQICFWEGDLSHPSGQPLCARDIEMSKKLFPSKSSQSGVGWETWMQHTNGRSHLIANIWDLGDYIRSFTWQKEPDFRRAVWGGLNM